MKLSRLTLYRYQYPLTKPIFTGGVFVKVREGFFIALTALDYTGWGEIAPLPHFHPWTMANILKEVSTIARSWQSLSLTVDEKLYHYLRSVGNISPIVLLGFDSAIRQLVASVTGKALSSLFCNRPEQGIAVQGIVDSPPAQWPETCSHLIEAGINTLKLKIGRFQPSLVTEALLSLVNHLPQPVRLRLDVQKYWDLKTAVNVFKSLRPVHSQIDYVEDPVKKNEEFADFYALTGIPVGLDVRNETELRGILNGNITTHFAVLKPEFWNSWERYWQVGQKLEARGITPVMSNAFTTEWTIAWQVLVGSCWHSRTAHGLGTIHQLHSHLFPHSIFQNKNFFLVQEALHCLHQLDKQQLAPVLEFTL